MTVACVIVTDGRSPETITKAFSSAKHNLVGLFVQYTIIDDSADPENAAWLEETFPWTPIVHHAERRGLGQTVRSAWKTALESGAEYIFHAEDDFTYAYNMRLDDMAKILDVNEHLAQVSLKRQAVNEIEEAAGGFMQVDPSAWYDRGIYVEHRTLFTFNPSLIPRRVAELVLSHDIPTLERDVTDLLIEHDYTFGVLGSITDPPKVHHIGTQRSSGYKW